jgi:uncharacterized protein
MAPASDTYATSFTFGTGNLTRYERIAAIDFQDYNAYWHGRDEAPLRHSSPPLREPCTLAGDALVTMWLGADEPDAAIHVYVEEVEEDGRCRHVTEGMLRALHRKTAPCPAHHKTSWPWRTFARSDAAILPSRHA